MKWLLFFVFSLQVCAHAFQEKRDQLERDGYVWIKHFYSPEQVRLLQKWADEVHDSAQSLSFLSQHSGQSLQHLAKIFPGALIVVPEAENPNQICRAEDMLSCFPMLHHFIYGTITGYLNALVETPYTLLKDKINFKWPGGGAFLPHQDFPAYAHFSQEHITAMVAIDAATIENGCLYVAKDWKQSLAKDASLQGWVLPYQEGGPAHGSIEQSVCDQLTWIPIEAEPGDLLFFDSFLPHYSQPNRSDKPRRAMFFTHNPLKEGDHRSAYYHAKREDPDNPVFHFATPTKARTK